VNTWDGKRWSGFEELGGQLKGLPAAVSIWEGDMTYVFGRGANDKLWYRRRTGTTWQRWQTVGEGLTSSPAAWLGVHNFSGGAFLTCEVLRQNGELWRRSLQLTAREYTGTKVTRKRGSFQYTLQSGDWLLRIARALSVDVNLIKKANREIRDFDQLDAGTSLNIPVTKHNGRVPYIVQQGDTLGRIANAFGTTVAGILSANSIQDADAIDVGAKLNIPVG
jgi:LysM repeat protein